MKTNDTKTAHSASLKRYTLHDYRETESKD